jgi:hypothetical protein
MSRQQPIIVSKNSVNGDGLFPEPLLENASILTWFRPAVMIHHDNLPKNSP